jgi:hypothetical protein
LYPFKITEDIKHLNISSIKQNLFYYKYDNRRLKSLIKRKEDKTSVSYLSAHSSFVGEIFENIIYELLLQYAKSQEEITKFILKGPHQNSDNRFFKSGLLIDKSAQIVYKSAYKDISEYDAMFFTKDSVYFVEMSTSKKTASLNKRLHKKQALLKVLFPSLKIKALIVLTQGSVGIKRFPSYCTVWVTKDFTDENLLNELLYSKYEKKQLPYEKHKKFVQTYHIRYKKFQYFQTLEWILHECRQKKQYVIDLSFFTSKPLGLYFDIFTKLYLGYMSQEEFLYAVPFYEGKIKRVIVSLEKINTKTYDIVYYVKHENGKLYRVFVQGEDVNIKEKEQEGFTNAEVRFLLHILKEEHVLLLKQINGVRKLIPRFLK